MEETLIVSEGEIKKMKEDVEFRLHEAERINKVMVGRELKMEEMRREMIRLRARIGELERKE